MKLVELLQNQNIIVQLLWGEQKIEFYSGVTGREGEVVYVTPYIHNGSELQLNVTEGRHGVVCNVFADNSTIAPPRAEVKCRTYNGKQEWKDCLLYKDAWI